MIDMTIVPDLAIDFEGQSAGDNWRPSRHWRGFAVEHVVLGGAEAYYYNRSGNTHYLAWHDMVLTDGVAEVDGLARDETRDLRNTITFLPSGCSIKGWSAPANRRNSYTALYFDPGILHEELESRYKASSLQPVLYAKDGPLQQTMRKLSAAVNSPDVPDIFAESMCIVAAVEALSLEGAGPGGTLTRRQIEAVSDYVSAHFTDDIGLQDLAAVAGLSRYHFGRAFKASTGQSPYAYILAQRVERACELLASTDKSIEQIALQTGFQSPARLRRSFQQLKGATPRHFRRQMQ